MPDTTLSRYYRALDEDRFDDALAMLDADLRFMIVLPTQVRRGQGRDAMRSYIGARGVPDRVHHLLRQSVDDDVEFFYGKVTDGGTPTGRFLAGARLGTDGLIASYQVTFDLEHVLVEDA
ncbi:MAG: nuclear transport factor 2 family protein [Marmoricola sp.]